MSQTVDEALERLEASSSDGRLAELCADHHIDLFVVFGSALDRRVDNPDDVDRSVPGDLDVAVRFEPTATHRGDILRLLNDLYALTGSERVDVMVLNRAGPVAREQALVRGRPLFQRGVGSFANAQIAAIMERLDTDHLRRLDLELMAE